MFPFLLFVIWISYAALEGVREALSDAGAYNYRPKHTIYTIQRIMMASVVVMAYYFKIGWLNPCFFMVAVLILSFSFIHNGFYFVARNKFAKKKVYPKGFRDMGISAFWEFSFFSRTIQLLFSLIFVALLITCAS